MSACFALFSLFYIPYFVWIGNDSGLEREIWGEEKRREEKRGEGKKREGEGWSGSITHHHSRYAF
jgi:hypothetical protein